MQNTVEGYVDHIIFRNEDNGYTVLNLMVNGSELTCVGIFEYIGGGASGTDRNVCGAFYLWTAV